MLEHVIINLDTLHHNSPIASMAPLFVTLASAIGSGWELEEPVVMYPSENAPQHQAYHFVLHPPRPTRSGTKRSVVIAPHNPQVERFVQQMGWRVI